MRSDSHRAEAEPRTTVPEPDDSDASAGSAPTSEQRTRAVRRVVLGLIAVVAVALAAYLVPMPSIGLIREWSADLGPWFAWLFFVVYAVATTAPVPRTAFTVASGVLFGPAIGFTGAILASMAAALVAFLLARRLGRHRVAPLLTRPAVATVEQRLQQRGWLAVGSLRLIPVCPFSVVNYLSGLSSVRLVPYLVATFVGTAPGTAAVVLLADALTGDTDPALLFVSSGLFALGLLGLVVDTRTPVKD